MNECLCIYVSVRLCPCVSLCLCSESIGVHCPVGVCLEWSGPLGQAGPWWVGVRP